MYLLQINMTIIKANTLALIITAVLQKSMHCYWVPSIICNFTMMLTKCSMRVDWLLSTHIRNIQRWDCRQIYYDRKHAMWEIKFPVSIDSPAFATSCMPPTSVKTLSYTLNTFCSTFFMRVMVITCSNSIFHYFL